jgi:hypothetical protein
VREAGSIHLVRRVHAFAIERGGRILNEGDVEPKLHAKASSGFDAGIRDKSHKDDLLDPPLFELGVEIGISEAALRPVFQHDDVVVARAEFGMELSTPISGSEVVSLVCPNLGWVHVLPPVVVTFSPAVMRDDNDLDTRRSNRRNQLEHVVVEPDRLGRLLGSLLELAAFTHEIVVRVDDQ